MAYTIQDFQTLNTPSHFVMTQHSRRRFAERGIKVEDVCNAFANGSIIEEYPEDFPVPSCLILGRSGEKVIHLCASIMEGYIYIITAYIPDTNKWEADWKTRKETMK